VGHREFVEVLGLASETSLEGRCRNLCDQIVSHSQASAIGLVAVSPADQTHVPLLNVGYSAITFNYHLTPRYTRHCRALKLVIGERERLLSWDDVPRFRESYEARAVYEPAGFRNGISVVLPADGGPPAALLHVSVNDDAVLPETKAILTSVRPLMTEWAITLARYRFAHLSAREEEVLSLIHDGRANAEIASLLAVSLRTVTTHVESILRKLSAVNRTEAAVVAERYGPPVLEKRA
jgi:DNA-binding CsgD family transcriptional regulator